MITVEVSGGLGNQMFRYAFGYAMSKKYHQPLCIDTAVSEHIDFRNYELDEFCVEYAKRITYHQGTWLWDRLLLNRLYRKAALGTYTVLSQGADAYCYKPEIAERITESGDYYLAGNWINYRYIQEERDSLRRVFLPKEKDAEVESLAEKLRLEESVAIHVRRGDYIRLGIELPKAYYQNAIRMIQVQHPDKDLKFHVFSDDTEYCKKVFASYDAGSFHFPEYKNEHKTVYDMYLMSQCKNLIIANSTYSWWAAYLAEDDACIIAPVLGIWTEDLYPKGWGKIRL